MNTDLQTRLHSATISIQSTANSLFDPIDPNFSPSVAVVALPLHGAPKREPFIIPAGGSYDETRLHDAVAKWVSDESSGSFSWSDSMLSGRFERLLHQIYSSREKEQFVGPGVWAVEQLYVVMPTLELSKAAVTANDIRLEEDDDTSSFLRVIIQVFLEEAGRLVVQYANDTWSLRDLERVSTEEVSRRAGQAFINAVARRSQIPLPVDMEENGIDWVVEGQPQPFTATRQTRQLQLDRVPDLFAAVNQIARMKHEGEASAGRMLLARKAHPDVEMNVELASPISLREHRSVRKLLEMSSKDLCLLWDRGSIYGLGRKTEKQSTDIFDIEFVSQYSWRLLNNERQLMIVQYEQPRLPRDEPALPLHALSSKLDEVFNIENPELTELLSELLRVAADQPHGTMVVVTENAQEESERLAKQSIPVVPFKLDAELMKRITAIDGAVIMDQKSNCYALGAILDGAIKKGEGDSSRGARFNSAVKYSSRAAEHNEKCVIVVVSEDGMVDLFPR